MNTSLTLGSDQSKPSRFRGGERFCRSMTVIPMPASTAALTPFIVLLVHTSVHGRLALVQGCERRRSVGARIPERHQRNGALRRSHAQRRASLIASANVADFDLISMLQIFDMTGKPGGLRNVSPRGDEVAHAEVPERDPLAGNRPAE